MALGWSPEGKTPEKDEKNNTMRQHMCKNNLNENSSVRRPGRSPPGSGALFIEERQRRVGPLSSVLLYIHCASTVSVQSHLKVTL